LRILARVEQTLPPTDLGGALEGEHTVRSRTATVNGEGMRRIAYCECGAQLAGGSEAELFDAVQQHLAHHHPHLLGALEPGVVWQMAEAIGNETPTGARGQST
jgi:hypothetical protein